MGLFDSLFGRKPPEIHDAEELRKALIDAALARDQKRLLALCQRYQEMIVGHFSAWRKVPDEIRNDQARTGSYIHGLIGVAECFAQRLGRPELMQQLMGTPEDNPLLRWQEVIRQARSLMGELRYPEAVQLLNDQLIDVREHKGTGVDAYLPVTFGCLGEAYFESGQVDKAVAPMRRALELCDQCGDAEGVVAYLNNLYEIHRYLCQSEQAAEFARRLSDEYRQRGDGEKAAWFKKQARLVFVGEPRNRLLVVINGRRYELDETPRVLEGRVQFVFERNRITLRPSRVWTERGETLGSAGKHDEALASFREAARADPLDPHPRYLAGLALLHLERAGDAVQEYQTVEDLAPGWFHCRADLWLARQIAQGHLDHSVFLAHHTLEDAPLPPEQKVHLAERVLAAHPLVPSIHLFHGKSLAALGRVEEAREAYRKGVACAIEADAGTRLLVELAVSLPVGAERSGLLRDAVRMNGNLVAAATATLCLRQES